MCIATIPLNKFIDSTFSKPLSIKYLLSSFCDGNKSILSLKYLYALEPENEGS